MISGFTIVRNALELEYPFRESVESLLPLCDEVIINCGDSTDGTRELCDELARLAPGKIRILDSIWERRDQKGGYQLKHQTDRALEACRGDWLVYLQADEVMHEKDAPAIRRAMTRAEGLPEVDGLLFDYLHFYGNYSYRIIGRNWYRREVRAFKKGRGIRAFRDAQGFRKEGERKLVVIPSGARVFHYGYVRSSASLQKKSSQMAQWWGETPVTDPTAFEIRRHVGLRHFRDTHPAVMSTRLRENHLYPDPARGRRKWDRDEIKNAVTLAWEAVIPYRIGEFRNYELRRNKAMHQNPPAIKDSSEPRDP